MKIEPHLESNLAFPLWRLVRGSKQNKAGLWIVDKGEMVKTDNDERLFNIRLALDYGGSYSWDFTELTIYYELLYEGGKCVKWIGGVYDMKNKKKLTSKLVAPADIKHRGEWICGKDKVEREFLKMKNEQQKPIKNIGEKFINYLVRSRSIEKI